jgi:hypothetical protein
MVYFFSLFPSPPLMKRLITTGIIIFLLAGSPHVVFARAIATRLTSFGTDRLVGLSTALFVAIIVGATVLMYCWNRLVAETNWPRLTHPKAIGVTFLGGLLFFLALVMIAGSREGILYELNESSKSLQPGTVFEFDPETLVPREDSSEGRLVVRRESLARLRDALWKYADENKGDFPETLPPQLQTIPVSGGVKYQYNRLDGVFLILEPDIHEPPQLGLTRQGIIQGIFKEKQQ